jgi:hypothetical protein
VILRAFIKKTEKTPTSEIDLALQRPRNSSHYENQRSPARRLAGVCGSSLNRAPRDESSVAARRLRFDSRLPLRPRAAASCCSPRYRGVAFIRIKDTEEVSATFYYPDPNSGPPTVDTRASGTTSPDSATYSFTKEGVRTLGYGLAVKTSFPCENPNLEKTVNRQFVVTKCVFSVFQTANESFAWCRSPPFRMWGSYRLRSAPAAAPRVGFH